MTQERTSAAQIVSFEDESLIVVDKNNKVLGHRSKAECHFGEGILHRAFSVFVFDGEGRLLLQQRSATKPLWPMYWSNSCCSHPRKGEESLEAATRRIREELGIAAPLQSLFSFQYHAQFGDHGSERELCEVFLGRSLDQVRENAHEIADWKWLHVSDFQADLERHPSRYTPWLKIEWAEMRKHHWAKVAPFLQVGRPNAGQAGMAVI